MNDISSKTIPSHYNLRVTILVVLLLSLVIPSSIVFADDTTPPPQENPQTEEVLEGETEEALTETAPDDPSSEGVVPEEVIEEADEEMPEQVVGQLPEGTDLVVVSQEGEIEPLVTQEAEEAIVKSDPIWCPEGVTPNALVDGCTDSYSNFKDLLNSLTGSNQPTQNGIIWVEKTYNSATAEPTGTNGITINGNVYKNWRNYSLTMQGGWEGLGTTVVDQNDPSTFSGDYLRILNWTADVAVKDIVIDGAAGSAGLTVTTTGDVTIERIESKNNTNNRGAFINNSKGNGIVTVVDSSFTDNGTGRNDDGIYIRSKGNVTLVDLLASGNGDEGVEIQNTASQTSATVQASGVNLFTGNKGEGLLIRSKGDVVLENLTSEKNGADGVNVANNTSTTKGSVTITGTNSFSENTSDGLYIRSKGAIALSNITADGSTKDSGARLDNDEPGATGNITITGNNSFSGNNDYGLMVYSRGDLVFENVVADNNKTQDGAYLDNDAGTGNVTITGVTSFSGNGNDRRDDGLFITSKGNVSLVNLVATGNRDEGVEIQNTASKTSATVQASGVNTFTGNKGEGLLIRSKGDVLLTNLTSAKNGADGVNVSNHTSTTNAIVSITGANNLSGNTSDGLYIRSKGAIELENITADGSKKDSGARLDNDEPGATGNITISGDNSFSGNNDYGLMVYSRGDLVFENVVADNNKTQDGAYLDNDAGTGNVTITGVTSFSGNGNGRGDDGLFITSKGNVSLVDLVATGNRDDGVEIYNYTSTTNAIVSITGANNLSGNTSDGLYIRSKGAIELENITADGSKKDSGARLDNDENGATGNITITGNNSFSGNNDYGLMVYSRGDLVFENVVADKNRTQDGAYLDNDAGTGNVTITGVTSFSGNGNDRRDDGLFITSKGNVSLVNLVATGNRDEGVEIQNTASKTSATVQASGVNTFTGNKGEGLLIRSKGDVLLTNLTSAKNGADGVNVSNHTSTTNAIVSITGANNLSGNTSDGLYIRSKGAIELENITADGSKKDSGARLDNDENGATGNITITGNNSFSGNNDYGLMVYSRGDLVFENVVADKNRTQDGAYLDNDAGTGNVTITGVTSFSGNGNGRGDDGLFITSKGNVSLVDLVATDNRDDGVEIYNYTSTTKSSVQIAGSNVFNGNTSDGLYIRSKGDILLSNITADGSKKDSGARLDNDELGAAGNITLTGDNSFSGNNDYGLMVYSRGDLVFENVVADNNKTQDGAYLDNDAGTGNVTITGVTSFSGNGNGRGDDGLYIISRGNIVLNDIAEYASTNRITANGNKGSGVRLDNDAGTGSVLVGGFGNNISNNSYDGLWVSSGGDVDIYHLAASGNKREGVEVITSTEPPNDVDIYCSMFENNGTYGVYGRYTRGSLTFHGDTVFSGNTKGEYYYQTSSGVATFDPDYDCDLPAPPAAAVPDGKKQKKGAAGTLLIPVTGGQLTPISCEYPFTTLQLTESERATFINLCGYDALLEIISGAEFPEMLRDFGEFKSGMTAVVLEGGIPVEILPFGSEILFSFTVPQDLQKESFSIVYWDVGANNGAGNWVAQDIEVVNGLAEIKVNFTGTFFLIAE